LRPGRSPYDDLLEGAGAGDDIIAANRREAKELATDLGGGKQPVGPEISGSGSVRDRLRDGYRWHYHPFGRPGIHVFYSFAPLLTLSYYAQGESCLVQVVAQIGDVFNPLAAPQDVIDILELFQ
jgi:hypothetical protein